MIGCAGMCCPAAQPLRGPSGLLKGVPLTGFAGHRLGRAEVSDLMWRLLPTGVGACWPLHPTSDHGRGRRTRPPCNTLLTMHGCWWLGHGKRLSLWYLRTIWRCSFSDQMHYGARSRLRTAPPPQHHVLQVLGIRALGPLSLPDLGCQGLDHNPIICKVARAPLGSASFHCIDATRQMAASLRMMGRAWMG